MKLKFRRNRRETWTNGQLGLCGDLLEDRAAFATEPDEPDDSEMYKRGWEAGHTTACQEADLQIRNLQFEKQHLERECAQTRASLDERTIERDVLQRFVDDAMNAPDEVLDAGAKAHLERKVPGKGGE